MVGEDLDVLQPHPVPRVAGVQAHPVRRRQAAVRDVTDERVMEAVAARRGVEVEPLGEPLERPGDLGRIAAREEGHVPRRKCLAGDRGALEQLLIVRGQLLQAGADHSVERERHVARDAERARGRAR